MGNYGMVGVLGGVLFVAGVALIYNRWANNRVNKEHRNARFMKGSMLGRRPYDEDEDD
ncbi:hypothetical protein [Cerasicoccus arenae]|uniref:Uncharacterized protein n=1 Tax=Cerasicoccus arenae TaxID=424488 RepID=A0A8J3DF44_9BACT|nr:hypothetical protein [Cerasicoccus arenae]MBK1857689.1 hypothetical protein [Cerasicoccus arenae]GHB91354.1 hypothetical protein GCM10007047_03030 [Cerasicoccus arenae]